MSKFLEKYGFYSVPEKMCGFMLLLVIALGLLVMTIIVISFFIFVPIPMACLSVFLILLYLYFKSNLISKCPLCLEYIHDDCDTEIHGNIKIHSWCSNLLEEQTNEQ